MSPFPFPFSLNLSLIIVSSADLTEYLIHPAWSAYSPANVDRCHISHGGNVAYSQIVANSIMQC